MVEKNYLETAKKNYIKRDKTGINNFDRGNFLGWKVSSGEFVDVKVWNETTSLSLSFLSGGALLKMLGGGGERELWVSGSKIYTNFMFIPSNGW